MSSSFAILPLPQYRLTLVRHARVTAWNNFAVHVLHLFLLFTRRVHKDSSLDRWP